MSRRKGESMEICNFSDILHLFSRRLTWEGRRNPCRVGPEAWGRGKVDLIVVS